MSPKPYCVEIMVRNNLFLSLMRSRGYYTAAELARASEARHRDVSNILNLSQSAKNTRGVWRPYVLRLAEFLRCLPEDMYPSAHIETPLANNRAEIAVSMGDVAALTASLRSDPVALVERREEEGLLEDLMRGLPDRHREVIRARFGLEDGREHTLEEIGKQYRVGRERIRQMELLGLRKIREEARSRKIGEVAFANILGVGR